MNIPIALLFNIASLIERDAELLATLDVLESVKPITQAGAEIAGAADIWRYAAALARDLHGESYRTPSKLGVVVREPIGVVSIITPWNFPFLIVSQKLPFALAAGCTAVVKPSELTSASTPYLDLGRLLLEVGLPRRVVNILVGEGPDVGAPLSADPRVDMVSFTGSTRVGKAAMAAAPESLKKVSMELGGKNPQIIFPDADLGAALDAVVFGAYFNAGECCNAGSRVILHESIGPVWVNTFMDGAAELAFGGTKRSGLGRELGRNAVADYREEKTLHFHAGPQTARWLPIRQSGAA
jgi:acyl-CoA reductase-like NAD-dependent aldehyde dehydrogenase